MDKQENHAVASADRFRLLVESVQDYAIFMLDPAGIVLSWNAGAARLKGYAADEVIGRHFSIFYPEPAKQKMWPDHELLLAAQNGTYEEEGWRVRKDGNMFWANVVITALRDSDGTLTGFGKVTRDLTERRLQEEALRQSEERFRLLIEGVRDYAIYMLDPLGMIQSWNSGAQLIKGYAASEVMGRHYSMFFRSEDVEAGLPTKELRDALQQGRTEEEGWRVRKDGSTFWANIVMAPIRGADGTHLGFAKVTRDMTERSRLRNLEHSSRQMNEFLAMLAHELRNPLAPIRNAVSILQLEPAPSATVRNSRDMIDRQLSQLTRLVDDLLDAGRMTSGKIRIKPERVSFNQIVARAVEAARPGMDARTHVFKLVVPADDVWVNADEMRLVQVLQNLLSNASKFTPAGGAITLSASVAQGRLHVDVTDNGEGISPASMESIFELFSQGDGLAASRQSGLGIGLSLARSLVEMHGGSIWASSPGAGQGSTFSFELPGAEIQAHRTAGMDSDENRGLTARVLVVDDNRDAADSLAEILRLLGYRVRTAYDGRTALEAALQDKPSAVFLDIGMPEMDGPAVLRALRAQPGGTAIFATAVTGYGAEDERAERPDFSGFDARLLKPVALADLQELLANVRLA
ncbi:PAS domain S-box protein [Acidovorax sp. CCYZU-2555]|uniref:PAS domain-containing hybrid sensor histidine kinase/response regulator n=1 Tax=Acidovorax sp. CCYZU-2555 TaxID=2835042 RepID=UPI001BCE86AF|nr:PAS domain S-box protein [Acidovorax sp. CCYZU-2555]MBS7781293.1 PAS domain S-box protein [Acidovorax sp. CCYZU-2555]